MNIVRWDPYRELTSFADRFNRTFGMPATRERDEEMSLGAWMPPVDISEDEDKIRLTTELPGVREDQVSIQMEGGVLTIRGERRFEDEKKGRNFHRVERSYGTFVRSFTLPNNVDREKIRATFTDGILEIEIPKSEDARPRQIKISAANARKEKQAIEVEKK